MDAGGSIDVVEQPHAHVDREGLASVGDEYPALDLGQDAGDTLRISGLCSVGSPLVSGLKGDQEPYDVPEVACYGARLDGLAKQRAARGELSWAAYSARV